MKKIGLSIITVLITFIICIGETKAVIKQAELTDDGINRSPQVCKYKILKKYTSSASLKSFNIEFDLNSNMIYEYYGDGFDYNEGELLSSYKVSSITQEMKKQGKCIDIYYSTEGEWKYFLSQDNALNYYRNYRCYYCPDQTGKGLAKQVWAKEKPESACYDRGINDEKECIRIAKEVEEIDKLYVDKQLESLTSCGNDMIKNIPGRLPKITSTIVNILKIAIPILIVIFGMIDLAKGVMSQKEDEIKKGQKTFITRLITGVIVFFVIFIVQILIRFVAEDSKNIISCIDCFINAECDR